MENCHLFLFPYKPTKAEDADRVCGAHKFRYTALRRSQIG